MMDAKDAHGSSVSISKTFYSEFRRQIIFRLVYTDTCLERIISKSKFYQSSTCHHFALSIINVVVIYHMKFIHLWNILILKFGL
jgi:hypothetical protein